MSSLRVYEVWSTYKVTGVAHVLAHSAAEAVRIGLDGDADGYAPQFDFTDPHDETRMRAVPAAPGAFPSEMRDSRGVRKWPVLPALSDPKEEQNG
jgi:hypothetical protein